ncbi:uncharacterized protein LOC114536664 [Dendronephthya gigantea]|uniref:uncharacterized protein LOC114536664 n=1 Tax=Dendronephthya gigantea TaxID=151771 RepID=UPI00106BC57E|nr:uncharacterized protein LOC114536664 [Dendronephthya gigantea]
MANNMANEINTACIAAANALQALGHLQPGFASNISPRLTESMNVNNSTETQTSTIPVTPESIQSRLQTCFPTIAARQSRIPPRSGRVSKRTKGRPPQGRPKKMIIYKDLVLLPSPDVEKVPTHNSRVKLEERQLVCHEFPFNKDWDEMTLKREIMKQFPQVINFEFVKPCYGKLIKPKFADGVQLNSERVIKMAGQGAVYVRSKFPLAEEDEDDEELQQFTFSESESGRIDDTNCETHTLTRESSLLQQQQFTNFVNELPAAMNSPHFNADEIPDNIQEIVMGNNSCPTEMLTVETVCSSSTTSGQNVSDTSSAEMECGTSLVDVSDMMVGNEDYHDGPNEAIPIVQQPYKVIKIHRLNVKKDMITAFKEQSIMDCNLTFVFIDGRGNEEKGAGIGVVRDVISLFWKDVYDSLLIGENERVPYIRHDYNRADWEAIARVLLKGYHMCQYLPLLVSKTFLSYVLFGELSINDPSVLIQSFMQYISADERRVIEKSLTGDIDFENTDQLNELLDVLKIYDCRSRVTPENIAKIIQEIAHKEIIQKPQYVTDCWKSIIHPLAESFPNPKALMDVYEQIKPSVSKITKCIQSYPDSDAERECLGFFRRYIRGLDNPEKLSTFVRFISGSELMLFDGIQVTFTNLTGLERRPMARTCNTLLQLPSTYQSFPELREEFNNILSGDNWEMDMV